MITDKDANFLYLADTLPKKQPVFFSRFEKVLKDNNIRFDFLPNTKDYWAVDYMPIQIQKDEFIRFAYNPDYLQNHKHLLSNADGICNAINLTYKKSDIVVDGGNVVRTTDKVIMCDKFFKENSTINKGTLIEQLIRSFLSNLTFIPTDPNDEFGHADGMVRFVNSDAVLINAYSDKDRELNDLLRFTLINAGLKLIEIPYNPYSNKTLIDATGIYINYLQMKGAVFVPVFNMKEDDEALKLFEQIFVGNKIVPVGSREIAKEGGIMNCITWNILKR